MDFRLTADEKALLPRSGRPALLRLHPGAAEPDLARVQRHLADAGLARQKWPEELHTVADFPRTASGKVRKAELRTRLQADGSPQRGG